MVMRIAAVTYTDALSGAGIAASRTTSALRDCGIDAHLLVALRRGTSDSVIQLGGHREKFCLALRQYCVKHFMKTLGMPSGETVSGNFLPTGLHRRLNATATDLIHLHWVGSEMVRIEEIGRIRRPVVWTFHDEWALLGLQHYEPRSGTARQPFSGGRKLRELDGHVRERKRRIFESSKPTIICPSRWLAQRTVESSLIPASSIHVIANAVPTDVFCPASRIEAKQRLGLKPESLVIGFGAISSLADARKGYQHLRQALARMEPTLAGRPTQLLVFGASSGEPLPIAAHYAGVLRDDETLAWHYRAMDVFVCPSTQENLPNTVAEAMACGVPCVAFRIGGLPDQIEHLHSGYLAEPYDPEDLHAGIVYCLERAQLEVLADRARKSAVDSTSPAIVADRHIALYQSILGLNG